MKATVIREIPVDSHKSPMWVMIGVLAENKAYFIAWAKMSLILLFWFAGALFGSAGLAASGILTFVTMCTLIVWIMGKVFLTPYNFDLGESPYLRGLLVLILMAIGFSQMVWYVYDWHDKKLVIVNFEQLWSFWKLYIQYGIPGIFGFSALSVAVFCRRD